MAHSDGPLCMNYELLRDVVDYCLGLLDFQGQYFISPPSGGTLGMILFMASQRPLSSFAKRSTRFRRTRLRKKIWGFHKLGAL